MKENKSLEINMLLNAVRSIMKIIFPLITFPYTSRVLGVENIGKYNFAASVVSYFSLIAGLGIATYAVREGVKFRNNRSELNSFVKEMLSFNLISTFISYILLFICSICSAKLLSYSDIILIISLNMVFSAIGMDWIYTIYEDYGYVTIRSIAVQFISMILLFVFVRSRDSLIAYTFIMLFSNAGSNIFNFLHIKKYCDPRLTVKINWKKHFKPVMIMFATSIAIIIYGSSDMTMLGFFCGDYEVGIYSVAIKIYDLAKMILASIIIASVPRLAALISQDKVNEFRITASSVYKLLISLIIPMIVGIIVMRNEIILCVSDMSYMESSEVLLILSFAVMASIGGWFYSQCILVPMNMENIVFRATSASAIINLILNFILIPFFREKAAAFTTLIAESIQFLICIHYGRRYLSMSDVPRLLIKILAGCIPIFLIDYFIRNLNLNHILHIMLVVVCSVLSYCFIEIIMKNDSILDLYKMLISRNHKR